MGGIKTRSAHGQRCVDLRTAIMEATKKKSLFGKEVDMLDGPITKGLLTIAMPVMIMNVTMSLFNIIDMSMLKSFDSDIAVGAVGACGYLTSLITGLLVGCSSGASVCIAKRIGRGDKEGVERAVGTAMMFSLLGGIVLAVIGVSCAKLFLTWMNVGPRLLPHSVLYFRMYFAGVPIMMIYSFAASVLRSSGDSTRPMIFLLSGGAVKVLLNALFVGTLGMGVAGVATATIISWAVTAVLDLYALIAKGGAVALKLSRLRIYGTELRETLAVGIPAGMQQALYSIANVIIATAVNGFGDDATTGISIANQFDGLLYQMSIAPALAVLPYVSQNVGRGNLKRAKQAMLRGMMITIAFGATFGALSAIFSGNLSSIMSDSPEVIMYSKQKMMIISSTYFICGINEVLGASMRGLGKPIVPTIGTLLFQCAIRFPWVWFVFPYLDSVIAPDVNNLTLLYLVWPIGWILSVILVTSFYIPRVRKLERIISASKQG